MFCQCPGNTGHWFFLYVIFELMEHALIQEIQRHLPLTDADTAILLSYFKRVKYRRNEILLQSGTVAKEVFFVVNGLLHQYYIDDAGNERTCDFTFENKFVTDLEGFSHKTPSASSIKALKNTDCMVITCDGITKLAQENEAARNYFSIVIEQVAKESMKRTKSLLTCSPEQRFSELLIGQPDIFQRVPQRYIAQYLGIAPESLSRIKKRLMTAAKS